MTDPDTMTAALEAEFGGDILFVPAAPSTYSPPQVVVVPDDPYLVPGTMGTFEEHWRVTVVAGTKEPRAGFGQLRELSHRLARTVQGAGGIWDETRGPSLTRDMVIAEAAVRFKYPPTN